MTDTAVHLEQHVLPEVPLRQWVCSLPWRLRYLCGYDRRLCSEVVGAFVTEVMRSVRHRAKRMLGLVSMQLGRTGAVTFVQRFDSALRLNVHPHTLALDGVYVRGADGHLVFHSLAEPSAEQVAEVARRTAKRVGRILQRHGRSLEGMFGSKAESEGESDCDDDSDTFADSQQALACCYGAATQGVTMFGERAGAPTQRMVRAELRRPSEPAAKVAGFDVHAKVAFDGRDRERVERLCRYLGRPPIAQDRLTELDDGRLRYTMKSPGATAPSHSCSSHSTSSPGCALSSPRPASIPFAITACCHLTPRCAPRSCRSRHASSSCRRHASSSCSTYCLSATSRPRANPGRGCCVTCSSMT